MTECKENMMNMMFVVYEEEGRDIKLWLRWHIYNIAFRILAPMGLWTKKISWWLW